MRILIIAYDYPPTLTPRALRWKYFSRELALLGHDVHMLVPDMGESGMEGERGQGRITVHRSFPGPCAWLAAGAGFRHRRRKNRKQGAASRVTRLNWRGRVFDVIKRFLGVMLFPDVRAEWSPWARRKLRHVLTEVQPDVVVASHEPASTLPMGMYAGSLGYPWVADIGDPICAPYTPPRWRKRAFELEARVSMLATHVVVTTGGAKSQFIERHGIEPGRCTVLPNGYDDRRVLGGGGVPGDVQFETGYLELIYAGRLYGYRDPTPLLQAVAMTPGVRLTLVVPDPPVDASQAALEGEQTRVFGPMPHAEVLRLQEQADVLVNLGNVDQPTQIPAKVYEYFGIPTPVLHLRWAENDLPGDLLSKMQRGWQCRAEAAELGRLLASLRDRKRDGTLHRGVNIQPEEKYSHSFLGKKLSGVLQAVSDEGSQGPSNRPHASHGAAGRLDPGRPGAAPDPIVSGKGQAG